MMGNLVDEPEGMQIPMGWLNLLSINLKILSLRELNNPQNRDIVKNLVKECDRPRMY